MLATNKTLILLSVFAFAGLFYIGKHFEFALQMESSSYASAFQSQRRITTKAVQRSNEAHLIIDRGAFVFMHYY